MPFDDEDPPRSLASETPAPGGTWGSDMDPALESPRDKFRRERDRDSSPDRRDRFGRDRRSRSPEEMRGGRRRSRSPVRRAAVVDDGDRYIPHYDRDRGRDRDRYGGGYGHRGYSRGSRGTTRGGDLDNPYMGNGSDGMGGRSMGGMPDPRSYDQVVPFKYFAEWLKTQEGGRRLEQEDVRERYEDYRREALQRLYTQFFAQHKEDDWFRERFEPERRKEYIRALTDRKAVSLAQFMSDLDTGKYDALTLTATTEQVMQHELNRRDQSGAGRFGSMSGDGDADESEVHTLFIRTVPPSVGRSALEDELKKQAGFEYLSLSEPRQDKQYHRFGWVKFAKGTDMEKALDNLSNLKIDEFQFHFSRHTSSSAALMRLAPDVASTEERIRIDLKLARAATKSLDERADSEAFNSLPVIQQKCKELVTKNGEDKPDEPSVEPSAEPDEAEPGAADAMEVEDSEEVKIPLAAARRELDLLIEYLRQVHLYCYYCGHTADNIEDFSRRCAKSHLRRPLPPNGRAAPSGNWTRNLDNRNDVIIEPLEAERLYKEGGKSVEKETDKELDKHIKQLDEGRFRCLLCTKLFKGDAFVRKHIRNKHPESIPESLVRGIEFFNNFVREAPHFVQLGTGGSIAMGTGGGPGAMVGGGGGMRDRTMGGGAGAAGFIPQMMPGMMIPSMMATGPYMMPGMVPGMMPGMMPMGGHFMGTNMMGMMGDRNQNMYGGQQYHRSRSGTRNGSSNRGGDPRAVRSYVDLDAPAEGEPDFGF